MPRPRRRRDPFWLGDYLSPPPGHLQLYLLLLLLLGPALSGDSRAAGQKAGQEK